MVWKRIEINEAELKAFKQEFAKKARFYLDESVDPIVADALRAAGLNVKTVHQLGLMGHPDENQFAAAQAEDRILLTHDEDFLNDSRFPPHRNPGVVVLPGGSGDYALVAEAIKTLQVLIAPYRELWRGSKVRIGADGHITVWGYEADTGRRSERKYKMGGTGPACKWVNDSP